MSESAGGSGSGAGGSGGPGGAGGGAPGAADAGTVKAGTVEVLGADGSVLAEFGKDGKPAAPNAVFEKEKEKLVELDPFADQPAKTSIGQPSEKVTTSIAETAVNDEAKKLPPDWDGKLEMKGHVILGTDFNKETGKEFTATQLAKPGEIPDYYEITAKDSKGKEVVITTRESESEAKAVLENLAPSKSAAKEIKGDLDPFADAPANPKPVPNPQDAFDKEALERVATARANDRMEAEKLLGLNTIEAGGERERKQAESDKSTARSASEPDTKGAQEAKAPQAKQATGNQVESDEIFTARQVDVKTVVPVEVEQKYHRVGDKFYHADKKDTLAFEDRGNKLETASNSESVAESMVRIAQARGWDEIKVSGTETFRKEAWLEAAARGMHVKGYSPSEQDKEELAKRVPENKIEKTNETFRARENTPEKSSETTRGANLSPADKDAAPGAPATSRDAAESAAKINGNILLDHGAAKYMHDKDNNDSYFVKTKDSAGKEHVTWGVDLGRAIAESGAKVGDKIALENEGKKAVTVSAPVRDTEGKVVGTEQKEVVRNAWNVQVSESFKKDAPEDAIKKHPELAGAYAALAAVDKKAEADGFTPEQRAVIAARVRQNAVNSIERGDFPEVKIKHEVEATQERHAEREQSR